MSKFGSVDEVLDFAIAREEEACAFYLQMAQRMDKPWMKEAFDSFADQELGHKDKLMAVKQGKTLAPAAKAITDLKISDYVVAAPVSPDMSYADALTVAMQREKKAFLLYTRLADNCGVPELKDTFEALAQEEAKHKLWLEVEYDDKVLTED
ncbi:MAG: ferritin family protein [Desulfarculus sp.]|nr:ferritin family protein [Pseudomonadota bacterium]MBV1716246.1 ferritin family protein [Desulfarculus sp.]MBU4574372.1 ferritin family protein [Pseudomonadota bacterium]MBU4599408.1 ferritin family protein [Pseudomonadota bacterium]MBV1737677.1 ferritin family protein [Desulfarculus sp.]